MVTTMVTGHLVCSLLSYGAFLVAFVSGVLFLIQERQLKRKQMGAFFHHLPDLETLDRVNMAAIGLGFVMLSIGMLFGVALGRATHGAWWREDPKVYGTIALWSLYLLVWLLRLRSTLRGRKVAVLSVLGFGVVLVIWLGVHHWIAS